MSGKLKAALVFIAVIAVAFFWLGNDKNSIASTRQIETAEIDTGDIKRTVATSGSVRPLITVEVGSQVSGQIKEIFVDFNSEVLQDQLLAVIDPQSFESRVLQNRADLRVASSNVIVQQANIDRAKANLRRAKLEYERAEPLSKQGTLSISELDAALATYDSAKADLTMAEAQLVNALAARDQREASLESAEIDLERTKIRSPIDGVVIERAVDQGQTVAASLSSPILFNIARDLTRIQIEANVDEADIGNVRQDNEVTFTVDAFPDMEFNGEVNQVRLAPNEANNVVTYTVIITADNPARKLLPGMTAIVEIVTGKSENVLRVSNDAIRFKPATGSELAKKSEAAQGEGGAARGRSRGGPDMAQLQASLKLDDSQVRAIETEMQEVFAGMRAQFQSMAQDADRSALREQMSQRVSAVFRKNLSEDQFKQYQQIRRQTAETRSGTIWVQSADGEINPVPVRFGISDDKYTQLFSDKIKPGDVVVTRIRSVKK
ncbi:MAG: efflux RND transporter periplasmic adaptor subunit [Gammaproteobacteria bacterium]|nr:efflux RND transporter periplasmic adaptor subunit [Gammaproteobacteria bacterium]NNK97585.1 HlyD family efflux transporter periplasmic adaptor subunit [Xanthomonadales bacterium]